MPRRLALVAMAVSACAVHGDATTARATYLANEGVLVAHGDAKVVFDPLFRNDFGTYELVPEEMEEALFAGQPPFDGLDAVLISHHHEDHFSPADVLRLLETRPELRLYAPAQAVAGIREVASSAQQTIFERVTSIDLDYQDPPVHFEEGEIEIEAVRVPHTGWPDRHSHVENIAYRVTLEAETTVVHLGDADTRDAHFAHDEEHWRRRQTDVAFPPYWFFGSEEGRQVLEKRIQADQTIGVHVPADVPTHPEDRSPELRGFDLFTEPGETREIP